MLLLTLVRHASTALNEARRYQGWCDPPLSGRGRAEARRLAERLAGERFTRVVASDLLRARDTAGIALPGAEVLPDPRLREMDFGAWDRLTYPEAERLGGERLRRWISDPLGTCPAGGEPFDAFAARVDAAMDALPAEGMALVVTHGGPIRRAVARAIGLEWSQAVLMQLSPCGITRLALHPEGGHLLCLNDTAHLENLR